MRSAPWLVLAAATAAACPAATPYHVTPVGNTAVSGAAPLADGDYACQIRDGGYDYPPFRCVVRADGARTVLEKVEGSVRFRGVIAPTSATSFRFDGELYCPWGDCTEPVRAEFRRAGAGYAAVVQPADARRDPMYITLTTPVQAAYGGYGYGGHGYGGYGYGGYGYGGYGYGGHGYGGYRPYR
jgi:hypothetical protein